MMRRFPRGVWPLVLLLAALSLRAGGCRKKTPPVPAPPSAAVKPESWPTPLLTPPPPQPTPTLYRGVTAVPALPE